MALKLQFDKIGQTTCILNANIGVEMQLIESAKQLAFGFQIDLKMQFAQIAEQAAFWILI